MHLLELFSTVRQRFPDISARADGLHERLWGKPTEESAYVWFESLANALNLEMASQVDPKVHKALLEFLDATLTEGADDLRNCLDVGFMENLFWQVASPKARPYWEVTPMRLRGLYVAFHGRTPLA